MYVNCSPSHSTIRETAGFGNMGYAKLSFESETKSIEKHCQANALKLANRAKNVVLATDGNGNVCGRKKCEE